VHIFLHCACIDGFGDGGWALACEPGIPAMGRESREQRLPDANLSPHDPIFVPANGIEFMHEKYLYE
jgi:hypothetical protein